MVKQGIDRMKAPLKSIDYKVPCTYDNKAELLPWLKGEYPRSLNIFVAVVYPTVRVVWS